MRPINFYVIDNNCSCSDKYLAYVAAETDERAIDLAAKVFKKNPETCRRRKMFYCNYYCCDKARIEIIHKLDGTIEGAVDIVDD